METLQTLFEKLKEMYDVKCPVCGAQWSFTVISTTKWDEFNKCNCQEMEKLLHERWKLIFQNTGTYRKQ